MRGKGEVKDKEGAEMIGLQCFHEMAHHFSESSIRYDKF